MSARAETQLIPARAEIAPCCTCALDLPLPSNLAQSVPSTVGAIWYSRCPAQSLEQCNRRLASVLAHCQKKISSEFTADRSDCRVAGMPSGRNAEWPECRVAGLPSGRMAEWPDCRVAGLLSGWIAEWSDRHVAGSPSGWIAEWLDCCDAGLLSGWITKWPDC